MTVRFANENELGRVNELREQVNALHVAGKPEVFKPGFSKELQDYVNDIWNDPDKDILVAELDGVVCGFAVLHYVNRPENPYMFECRYLDIDEFGVAEGFRRRGAGTAMIAFIRALAAEKGYSRVELNMWEFNAGALKFYEAAGFKTYRRYMETYVDE
ncbi:MAG: GNAT family N-acetyltransferase [Oscillospiraceae bacterium]|nr:GNAT family N-acetyltransferase [Oscillospiraceae bacterium]